jgi:beta-lactam-binding protein with PASTA domain
VPDLSGKTAKQAEDALKQAGFTKAPTFKSADPNVQFPGDTDTSFTVTAQNPTAGSQAPPDSDFVLTMTNGNMGKG